MSKRNYRRPQGTARHIARRDAVMWAREAEARRQARERDPERYDALSTLGDINDR